jgi:glutathione S-transferase
MDTALEGKQYLVGEKCTIADLAFVNWDLTLDIGLKGDAEAATAEQREKLYPNWTAWHRRVIARPAVQKMMKAFQEAQPKA